jgi:hypothetical protein
MKWLLRLYPPRWRRRYGDELGELIASQPFSIGTMLDLLVGAVDAWTHPGLVAPGTSGSKGEGQMIAKTLRLGCAGYGPEVTSSDKAKSAMVMLGGALTLTLLWLSAIWKVGGNAYLVALGPMAYLVPYLVSLQYTALKDRSTATQAILVTGISIAFAMFLLLVAWIGTRI